MRAGLQTKKSRHLGNNDRAVGPVLLLLGIFSILLNTRKLNGIKNDGYYLSFLPPNVTSLYTQEALENNPYLGWQPSASSFTSSSNFTWRSCFNGTQHVEGPNAGNEGIDDLQPPGCRERSSDMGTAPLVNTSDWVPDVTMLRTALAYGFDRDGNVFPPRLSKELCDKIHFDGTASNDDNRKCFLESKIQTGQLSLSTVTIHPWNHADFDQYIFNVTNRTASITQPAPKVMCLIYTIEAAHATRIRAIRETWGGGFDGFLAFSTKSDPRIPAIHLNHDGPEDYNNMWQKVRSIWKFVGKHYLQKFEWFVIGGDDLFLLPHNLKMYLASLAYKDNANPRVKEYYLGKRQKAGDGVYFNTGGAGYVLSQASLRKLLTVIDDPKICNARERTSAEDLNVAKCLRHFGIGLTDTRDLEKRERFHFFEPAREFTWDVNARNWVRF